MKKNEFLGIRISEDVKRVVRKLAREDQRTLSWTARELIVEALENRGLIKGGSLPGKNAKRTKKRR